MNCIMLYLLYLFTGFNSSLFESKVTGGFQSGYRFNVKYMGFIVIKSDHKRMNTATFINERNCLIPRERAKKMENSKRQYLVETPISNEHETYPINKMFYSNNEDGIAAYWALIKVSYKI